MDCHHIDYKVLEKKLILPDSYYERSFPPRLDLHDTEAYTFYIYPMEIALETLHVKDKHKKYIVKILISSALSKMRQAMEIAQSDEE